MDVRRSASSHHYQGTAGEVYHRSKRRLPDGAYPWVARLRRDKFDQYVGATDTVVEFGAGAGWNLAELQCGRRIAVDVADFLADEVRARGIEFVSTSGAVDSDTADVVLCHHMLEHVTAPAEVLAEVRRVLKPTGRLVLAVPYESQRRFRTYDRSEPNHHLYAWNAQTLAALVEECDFEVVRAGLGPYGYDRVAASLAHRLRLGERGFRLVRSLGHLVRPVREVRVDAVPRPGQDES